MVIVRNFLYIIVKFAEDGIFILLIRKKSAIINNIQEVVIDVEDCRGILMAARDHQRVEDVTAFLLELRDQSSQPSKA